MHDEPSRCWITAVPVRRVRADWCAVRAAARKSEGLLQAPSLIHGLFSVESPPVGRRSPARASLHSIL